MNIWFLLWVFLAIFIIGLFGWSLHILMRQKRAWAQFAEKNNLTAIAAGFFSSSNVSGTLKGFPFYLYSEEQTINQSGSKRFRTIVQFELPGPMVTPGIIASAEAGNFARGLNLKESYTPEFDFWNKGIVVLADDAEKLKAYMTEDRCKSLNALLTIKTIATILIFDDKNVYLRFETADAFDDFKKLDRFVAKAVEQVKILSM